MCCRSRRSRGGAAHGRWYFILPEPACAGGHQVPRPGSRQSQFPEGDAYWPLGMYDLTHLAAPRFLSRGVRRARQTFSASRRRRFSDPALRKVFCGRRRLLSWPPPPRSAIASARLVRPRRRFPALDPAFASGFRAALLFPPPVCEDRATRPTSIRACHQQQPCLTGRPGRRP